MCRGLRGLPCCTSNNFAPRSLSCTLGSFPDDLLGCNLYALCHCHLQGGFGNLLRCFFASLRRTLLDGLLSSSCTCSFRASLHADVEREDIDKGMGQWE